MIEGINSSLANTQASRAAATTVSTAKTLAVDPVSTGNAATSSADFTSSYVKVDSSAAIRAILQFRDTSSGEVLRQFPTESQLQAYSKTQAVIIASQNSSAQLAVTQETASQDAVQKVVEIQAPVIEAPVMERKPVEAAAPTVEAPSSEPVSSGGNAITTDA